MKLDRLAAALVIGVALIVAGVSMWSVPFALIVAGLLVGALGWLLFAELDEPVPPNGGAPQ